MIALAATQAYAYARNAADQTLAQRQTLAVVHATFPEPVRYLDGYGVVARFPRVGFFMSSWGMQDYLAVGQPVFAGLAAAAPPALLLADSNALIAALRPTARLPGNILRLLPEDERFLRENYRPYWGTLFLPGKRILPPAAGGPSEFEIAIPGRYRMQAAASVVLDEVPVELGGTVELGSGPHRLDAPAGTGAVVLDWAGVPPPPAEPPVDRTFFVNFVDLD